MLVPVDDLFSETSDSMGSYSGTGVYCNTPGVIKDKYLF
jgi:hypothetical protein